MLADSHRAPYLPNGKVYELQTWYRPTDGGRRPASATGATTSKVKGQGRKVTWSVLAVLGQCCTCHWRPAGAYRVGWTRRPHFLFVIYQRHVIVIMFCCKSNKMQLAISLQLLAYDTFCCTLNCLWWQQASQSQYNILWLRCLLSSQAIQLHMTQKSCLNKK